jgi:cytoskeletal protein CcmA (bactofilin family)
MKKVISSVFLSFVVLFLSLSLVFAQEPESNNVYIASDETVEQNPYFAAGERVEIYGTVEGDVYTSGGEVVIDGVINGDLFVGGGTVRINGVVTNNVKVGGGQIRVSGEIGGNLVAAGGDISIEDSASIGSYVVIAGGNVTTLGKIKGNTYLYAGNVNVNSQIDGNLDAKTGLIRIGPKTTVGGDLMITSDEKPTIDESATIEGETTIEEPVANIPQEIKEPDVEKITQVFAQIKIIATLISALSVFIVGLILMKLFPKYMEISKDIIEKKTWRSLGFGLLGLFATPLVILILFIFIVTMPLAFMTIAIYSILIYLAKIFVIYWAGRRFFDKSSKITSFALSLLLYTLLMLLPVVGGLLSFVTLLFGLGAGLLACHEIYLQMKANKIA